MARFQRRFQRNTVGRVRGDGFKTELRWDDAEGCWFVVTNPEGASGNVPEEFGGCDKMNWKRPAKWAEDKFGQDVVLC